MGRWRPPAPAASAYITPAGFEALQKELDDTWRRRREVVKALAAAAAVELRNSADETLTYRIVGPDEADTSSGAISMDSPLAKALLGKQTGDEILIETPDKTATLNIVSIRYETSETQFD